MSFYNVAALFDKAEDLSENKIDPVLALMVFTV